MMCAFHDSNCNGFGDMWWTGKCTYFSSIDSNNQYCHIAYRVEREFTNLFTKIAKKTRLFGTLG